MIATMRRLLAILFAAGFVCLVSAAPRMPRVATFSSSSPTIWGSTPARSIPSAPGSRPSHRRRPRPISRNSQMPASCSAMHGRIRSACRRAPPSSPADTAFAPVSAPISPGRSSRRSPRPSSSRRKRSWHDRTWATAGTYRQMACQSGCRRPEPVRLALLCRGRTHRAGGAQTTRLAEIHQRHGRPDDQVCDHRFGQ